MKIDDEIQSKFINPQTKAIVNLRYTANLLNSIQNFEVLFYLLKFNFNWFYLNIFIINLVSCFLILLC